MYEWGHEFGGFLDLCEKVFFLIQCRGGGLSPHRSSFFYTVNDQNITSHYVRSSEHKFFLVALLADISMFIYLQSLLQLLRQVIQLTQIDELVLFLGTLKIWFHKFQSFHSPARGAPYTMKFRHDKVVQAMRSQPPPSPPKATRPATSSRSHSSW